MKPKSCKLLCTPNVFERCFINQGHLAQVPVRLYIRKAHFDLEFTIQKEVRTNDVGANEVRIVDNQDNWWSEKLRQSFVLNQSDDSSYVLSMTANSIFDLFQLYLRKEKRLTHAAAQEYSRKNFCSKLTAMESDYGVIKKRVPQGYKYHLRLDQLVKELDVSNYDLEE